MMKRYLENVSVRMGLGGEITDEVIEKAEEEYAHVIEETANSHLPPPAVDE